MTNFFILSFCMSSLTFQLILLAAIGTVLINAQSPTLQLGNTTLNGTYLLNGSVEFFGAIPYAEPPIGALRFKSPIKKYELNVSTFNATQFGSPCLQLPPTGPGSEDCLFVNIFRPKGLSSHAALPVMVWIHGGGFKFGNPSSYNAAALVSQSISRGTPVLYVSMAYRLGPLGFPQGVEAANKGALNLALQDQLTALQWVRRNIGVFGGNKDKVTLFGESGGAASVAALQVNNKLKGLIRALILESGTTSLIPTFGGTHRQDDWDNFATALPPSCSHRRHDVFDCLQDPSSQVSSTDLLTAVSAANSAADEDYPWAPTLDHDFLPDLPSSLLQAGKYTHVPMIIGNNLDEGTYFATPLTNSTSFIRDHMIMNFTSPNSSASKVGRVADQLLQLYPDIPALGSPYNTGNKTFGLSSQFKRYSAILGDIMFHAPSRFATQTMTFVKAGVPVYTYLFTGPVARPLSPPPYSGEPASLDNLGVVHTGEVPYVYNFTAAFKEGDVAAALGRMMVDYWVSFATSLTPNDGHGIQRPDWCKYSLDAPMNLELNSNKTAMISDTYRSEQIKYINDNARVFSH
ncbi:Carboxylic ester hydrolase [Mycena indigotica]|uniref:Carboxylic ester hydrolase n=1 Tax=Mycena indigotica TaxID=2126181 RepID=A0A8H6VQ13_9AGAR|nr:Carboxylic ester hydrolase [Mycena indigotica]KAF7289862.1 Carboxylic ester hydrolase [Mycena indigotica]